MRAKYLQVSGIVLIAFFGVGLAGCRSARRNNTNYIDPHSMVFAKTAVELKEQFSRSGQRVAVQEVETAASHWLFVRSFPYRGRDMFDVYVFEQPVAGGYDGNYTLRSMSVVYNSQHLTAELKSKNGGVGVFEDGRMLMWFGPRDAAKP